MEEEGQQWLLTEVSFEYNQIKQSKMSGSRLFLWKGWESLACGFRVGVACVCGKKTWKVVLSQSVSSPPPHSPSPTLLPTGPEDGLWFTFFSPSNYLYIISFNLSHEKKKKSKQCKIDEHRKIIDTNVSQIPASWKIKDMGRKTSGFKETKRDTTKCNLILDWLILSYPSRLHYWDSCRNLNVDCTLENTVS